MSQPTGRIEQERRESRRSARGPRTARAVAGAAALPTVGALLLFLSPTLLPLSLLEGLALEWPVRGEADSGPWLLLAAALVALVPRRGAATTATPNAIPGTAEENAR
jgi:hypothetical protein